MNPDLDEGDGDERGRLGAETLLANMLGLMTAHAETRCDAERRHLAHKIATDLSRLAEEPTLSEHFRVVLYTMKTHWRYLQNEYTELPAQPDSIYTRGGSTSLH